jgi:hypothetical protein
MYIEILSAKPACDFRYNVAGFESLTLLKSGLQPKSWKKWRLLKTLKAK